MTILVLWSNFIKGHILICLDSVVSLFFCALFKAVTIMRYPHVFCTVCVSVIRMNVPSSTSTYNCN